MKKLFSRIYTYDHPALKQELWGLTFKNPVGLAAGFDKNAELVEDFVNLGFGFIEVGTVTPKAQYGNRKPRLFRLPKDRGLINRMGFNNNGLENAVKRLKNRKSRIIVGGNIGKNKTTPNKSAVDDYLTCLSRLYDCVDYFVVNVSSPNTPGLRELQERTPLESILTSLITTAKAKKSQKPILLKIAPDLTKDQLDDILEMTETLSLDGLVLSNTTTSRGGLKTSEARVAQIGNGGLSGAPVFHKSNEVLRYIRLRNAEIPIIAVGGVMTPEDAVEKIRAGANLIQIYTGLVYRGPVLIRQINKALARYLHQAKIPLPLI